MLEILSIRAGVPDSGGLSQAECRAPTLVHSDSYDGRNQCVASLPRNKRKQSIDEETGSGSEEPHGSCDET